MRVGFLRSLTAVLVIGQLDASNHRSWLDVSSHRSWLSSAIFLKQDPSEAVESIAPEVDYKECTCSCCETVERTPEEIKIQSVYLKCAHKYSDVGNECPNKCAVSSNLVLPAGTSDKGINYDRFCLYYCQPFDTEVTGPCIRQNATEQAKAATQDGNGEDNHLPPQGSGDFVDAVPPTTPKPPPTLEELPCEERAECQHKFMMEGRDRAEAAWGVARDAAEAARAAANS